MQVAILIVFQQCISQNQSMYQNIYFTRLLGITRAENKKSYKSPNSFIYSWHLDTLVEVH